MYLVEIIPISRGVGKESLTYFSKDMIPEGSLVSIPLRKKSFADGLVIGNKEVLNEKAEIRKSDFALRKIGKVKAQNLLSKSFVEAAKESARFFAGTTGSVLNSFIQKNNHENTEKITGKKNERIIKTNGLVSEHLIVQDEDNERFSTYKSLIREEFAKNNSVYFCLPTALDAKKAYGILEKGIGQYAFLFHPLLSKKEFLLRWNNVLKEEHPVLIVGTGNFLGIPRDDWGLIIIDKEGSKHYKSQTRPYLDMRVFAEILANKLSARVVFGDIALRAETIWRYRRSELSGVFPPKFKYLGTAEEQLVDMRKKSDDEKKVFELLSPRLLELIKENRDNNEHFFIFSARRGLSPITVCSDCGNVVKCQNCDTPTVLHKASNKYVYVCHRCNRMESSERRCSVCESWKLTPLGIGVELLEENIAKKFPEIKIFRIDSDETKTEKKVLETVEKWQGKPGSILIGTEMALPYLPKVENVAILSIDSLFSVPDFKINEKIFGIILLLRSLAMKNFILQTRNPEQKAISLGISGNLLDFYKEEIKEREEFGFPPFNLFIKISLSGERSAVSKDMKVLEKILEGYELDIFSGVSSGKIKKYTLNALLRIKKDLWLKDDDLFLKLSSLPPKFSIKVDPESLL